ncbi:MAG TPA: 3-phenylpropionate/cinnamic acid dioxygenase subunit beta [Vicinamibacterales bacterium]|nr:3-phenylpropionate/cinnamic acid dioxygenase subunit beta [Vicinamibacterales bacterium]
MRPDVMLDVEQFLFREAHLLDERRFQEWLGLLADDIRYWMPTMGRHYGGSTKAFAPLEQDQRERPEFSGEDELAILDETKDSLARRVARLDSGMAWSEEPPSRTCRFISNVIVDESDTNAGLIVRSNFILYRTRGELERDFYVGSRQDVLRSAGGSWKIAYRKILVPQNVLAAKNISNFF